MSDLKVIQNGDGVALEWFDDGEYVFDAAGLTNADVAALQLIHSAYDGASRDVKMKLRGMLRLVVELWNRGAEFSSEEILMWIYEETTKKEKGEMRKYEFDMTSDDLSAPALVIIAFAMAAHQGEVLEYEKIGPAAGNERFVVQVPENMVPYFETWLRNNDFDVEAARA